MPQRPKSRSTLNTYSRAYDRPRSLLFNSALTRRAGVDPRFYSRMHRSGGRMTKQEKRGLKAWVRKHGRPGSRTQQLDHRAAPHSARRKTIAGIARLARGAARSGDRSALAKGLRELRGMGAKRAASNLSRSTKPRTAKQRRTSALNLRKARLARRRR